MSVVGAHSGLLGVQQTWVWIWALPFARSPMLSKSLACEAGPQYLLKDDET